MQKISAEQSQTDISLPHVKAKKWNPIVFIIVIVNLIVILLAVFLLRYQTSEEIKSNILTQTLTQTFTEIQTPVQTSYPLTPFYIWLGKVPQKHLQKLKKIKYPFRLIQDCDILLQRLQQQLKQKFSNIIYDRVQQKSDVCRYAYLYFEGGLYLDLDTDLDYQCMQDFLKDQNFFFEMNNKTKGIDVFTIYSAKPKNPDLKRAISFQNTFRLYSPYHTKLFYTLPKSAYNVTSSKCVKHYGQKSWK